MNGTPNTAPAAAPDAADERITFLSPPVEFQMADDWYELAVPDHFWFQWRFLAIERLLAGQPIREPALEVGCGNGVARKQIEDRYGCKVDACDVNLAALRVATPGRGGLYFYNIHERRPEWAEHFETIVLLDTLEHIPETEPFLRSIAYHLRPGGLLLINVPAVQWLYGRYDSLAGHVKRYDVPTLERELEAGGFSLVRHAYWGLSMLPVLLARKLLLQVTDRDAAIRQGFQPPSRLADTFLRSLMRLEVGAGVSPPLGSSLLALARKT